MCAQAEPGRSTSCSDSQTTAAAEKASVEQYRGRYARLPATSLKPRRSVRIGCFSSCEQRPHSSLTPSSLLQLFLPRHPAPRLPHLCRRSRLLFLLSRPSSRHRPLEPGRSLSHHRALSATMMLSRFRSCCRRHRYLGPPHVARLVRESSRGERCRAQGPVEARMKGCIVHIICPPTATVPA